RGVRPRQYRRDHGDPGAAERRTSDESAGLTRGVGRPQDQLRGCLPVRQHAGAGRGGGGRRRRYAFSLTILSIIGPEMSATIELTRTPISRVTKVRANRIMPAPKPAKMRPNHSSMRKLVPNSGG